MHTLLLILFWSVVGTIVIFWCVHGIWRARSAYRVAMAEPAPFRPHRESIWRDPGDVERLNLAAGAGGPDGAPAPPYRFVEEHATGSSPCVSVIDARNRTWRVKWGNEVRSESLAVRIVWAVGYFVETTYFLADGAFREARFELDERGVTKLFEEHGWSWIDNPFVGTRELYGLKIMMMLLSNWDNKDVRDVARGSNTAIFQHHLPNGLTEARYLIIDWGGTMGRWGSVIVLRGKWDVDGYESQTPSFITGVSNGQVAWGYSGQRTADATEGITVDDVRWLWRYLGRLQDAQIEDALRASGADPGEILRFRAAIRGRLEQIGRVAAEGDNYVPAGVPGAVFGGAPADPAPAS